MIIDMELLQKEVLDKPAEAALPHSLSNYWLTEISAALEAALENDQDADGSQLAAPVALISRILTTKNGGELSVTWEEFIKIISDYRMEIAMEEVSRHTNIEYKPATLETIFTNRNIEFEMPQVS